MDVLKNRPGSILISYIFQLDFSDMLAQREVENSFLDIPHIDYLVEESHPGFTKERSCLEVSV